MERIKNLTVQASDAARDAEWATVAAFRNRLLSVSDWTQMPDSEIDKLLAFKWKIWRHSLRAVSRDVYDTPEKFKAVCEAISKYTPRDASYDPVIDKKTLLHFLDLMVETEIRDLAPYTLYSQRSVEAVLFLNNQGEDPAAFPLLTGASQVYSISMKEAAEQFLLEQAKANQQLSKISYLHCKYTKMIETHSSDMLRLSLVTGIFEELHGH